MSKSYQWRRWHSAFALCLAAASIEASDTFEIVIERGAGVQGSLTCVAAGLKDVPCYWDSSKRIPALTYFECSTTIMATKGYKAVFIPNVPGFDGIFIHRGESPDASDGCIVTAKTNVEKIWATIPRDLRNITVRIKDP